MSDLGMALSGDLRAALTAFAAAPSIIVALDFDGVLAPLVPRPEDSRPLPEAVAALTRLAADPGVGVALVSGRALHDAALLRAAPAGAWVIGSHGAEPGQVGPDGLPVSQAVPLQDDQTDLLARLTVAAQALTANADGSWVERKPTAAVLHTRPVHDQTLAADLERRALDELGSWPGVRAIAGSRVVELSVAHATKGDAIGMLRDRLLVDLLGPAAPVLFAGDDVTDEDALAVLGAGDIGIKVGEQPTLASFRVADPAAVAQVLHTLADGRPAR